MNFKEYVNKLKKLEDSYRNDINRLQLQYALGNSGVEIGDIIINYVYRIRVEKMTLSSRHCLVFTGPLLTKNNIPYKNNARGKIWEPTIVEVIKGGQCPDTITK